MSGHSKWSQIHRAKGVNDAKRGQIFTRLGREISIATREGHSGDINANFKLRLAVQRARDANMPMENIERSIKRALGGADIAALEEIVYEGYGPAGTAVMVQTYTDNRNRTVAEVRTAFSRSGGNLGETGCVNWLSEQRGVIEISTQTVGADAIELDAIDCGAIDVEVDDTNNFIVIYTQPSELEVVKNALEKLRYTIKSAEYGVFAKNKVDITDEKVAHQVIRLVEKLEELEDVQNVYSNAEFSESFAESYTS
jgi:YebC/PmpR family DNA-binding regulatory protein